MRQPRSVYGEKTDLWFSMLQEDPKCELGATNKTVSSRATYSSLIPRLFFLCLGNGIEKGPGNKSYYVLRVECHLCVFVDCGLCLHTHNGFRTKMDLSENNTLHIQYNKTIPNMSFAICIIMIVNNTCSNYNSIYKVTLQPVAISTNFKAIQDLL